jgi:hydroxymethylbilane synthase
MVGSLDGQNIVRGSIEGDPAQSEQLGAALAEQLLGDGARSILDTIRRNV